MSTNAQAARRLDFIDAHRGIAVLLMLWLHSADGWLRPELKAGPMWDFIRGLGGLAAPTFLLLSGVGLALGWGAERAIEERAELPARRREIARALQLVVLGYALRLQMWMLDGAGYRLIEGWAASVPLGLGYAGAYVGLGRFGRGAPTRRWLATAFAGVALGLGVIATLLPHRLGSVLRVDVLQAIGASLLVLALLRTELRRAPWLGLALGAAVALATPALRSVVPGPLPAALAGYLAAWPGPAGQPPPTLFPLFPWCGYALVGSFLGLKLAAARRRGDSLARTALAWSGAALIIAVLVYQWVLPWRFLNELLPWSQLGLRMAYRSAVVVVLGGAAVLLCATPVPPLPRALVALGRASLVVYWVHLQFAFGSASRPIARQLGMAGWAMGLVVLTAAMILLALAWAHLRARFRWRSRNAPAARAVASYPAPWA